MKTHQEGHLLLLFFLLVAFFCVNSASVSGAQSTTGDTNAATLVRVDPSGKGDYTKIQDAIDAVPSNNTNPVFVWVKPGIYTEKVVVPADKPFITLSGTSASNTIITWDDYGDILQSPTLSVLASDFVGRYLTIQNTYGTGAKAVALRVSGDRVAFLACRINGRQDTLLDDTGRHYYSNCYIEGDTDFIFGNGASVFEKCHVHSVSPGGGAITAQARASPSQETGFVFLACKVTVNGTALLGRPWGAYARVIFALSFMSSGILPQGWDDWGDSSKQRTAYYGEYECYGPGAIASKRVPWALALTADQALPFLTQGLIDDKSWLRSTPLQPRTGSGNATRP